MQIYNLVRSIKRTYKILKDRPRHMSTASHRLTIKISKAPPLWFIKSPTKTSIWYLVKETTSNLTSEFRKRAKPPLIFLASTVKQFSKFQLAHNQSISTPNWSPQERPLENCVSAAPWTPQIARGLTKPQNFQHKIFILSGETGPCQSLPQ